MVLGAVLWTLLEYTIHRIIFHMVCPPLSMSIRHLSTHSHHYYASRISATHSHQYYTSRISATHSHQYYTSRISATHSHHYYTCRSVIYQLTHINITRLVSVQLTADTAGERDVATIHCLPLSDARPAPQVPPRQRYIHTLILTCISCHTIADGW